MNCIVSIINEDDKLQTICVLGAIIAEDGTAEKQAQALVGQFQESGRMLDLWRDTTREMFADHKDLDELLAILPTSKDLCVSRLLKSMLSTDTCNTAKSVHVHFKDLVFGLCRNVGIPEKDCIMYSGF